MKHRSAGIRRASRIIGLGLSLLFTSGLARTQDNRGLLDVLVTRFGTSQGIPGVTVTLQGPFSPTSTSLFTPNPALTADMQEQIDILFRSAPPGISNILVFDAARRLEAQLLGLPAPAPTVPSAAADPPVAQLTAMTDASGHYLFSNLAPGRYRVRAQLDGYFGPPPLGNAIGSPPTVTTTLTIDESRDKPAEVQLAIVQGATVSGRVRSPDGQPLAGIPVYAYQIVYPNGRVALSSVNSKTTDDRGEYRLYWLPPGEYLIGAMTRRFSTVPNPQDSYARTFYPGTIDVNAATRLKIGEGDDVAGVDIGLRADATAKIFGRIVTSIVGTNGQPVQAASFFLLPEQGGTLFDAATMNYQNMSPNRTNSPQFELRGVLPGSYDLVATIPDGNGGQAIGRVRVQVPNSGNVEGVTLNVKPGIQIKAHMTLDPPAGTVTPSIRLTLRSLEAYPAPFETAVVQSTVDATGSFIFSNVPEGRFFLFALALPANSYISDVQMGGQSVFDNGFVVDSRLGELEVRISSKGARIQGTVLDSSQKPAPYSRVVLVPDYARRQNQSLYKTAVSDSKGGFNMSGVGPGLYKLFAWTSVPGTAYMSAEFMAPYEAKGQVVRITEGAASNVVVNLIQ